MKYSWLIISLLVVLLQSCNTDSSVEQTTRTVVVEVYDQVLYEDQILNAIPVDASGEDSTSIRNSYINSWINRQLMVKQAEANLPVDQKDVEIKLEKYRQDLLIFSYQNQLLLEKLDTNVADSTIQNYYNSHQDMFGLVDYILKVRYIKLDSATFKNKKVRRWLMSDKDDDYSNLDEFCYMHSSKFMLEENWVYLDEFLEMVPIVTYNKEKLLKNKNLIELYDNGFLYLVRIMDYKLKDGISPLSFEKNNIRRIILNNRKIEFLDKLSDDIYQKAKKEEQIEIY